MKSAISYAYLSNLVTPVIFLVKLVKFIVICWYKKERAIVFLAFKNLKNFTEGHLHTQDFCLEI